jgi:hypothetical protein
VLNNVTGCVRRPTPATVGSKLTGEAEAARAAGVNDDDENEDDEDDVGRGIVAGTNDDDGNLGTVGTTGVGASVVAGAVGELATSDVVGVVGVVGGLVVGGPVVVVVVVVSTTSGSDAVRSAAHTAGTPGVDGGGSARRSTALPKTSQRPCCEIATRPVGSEAASSGGAASVTLRPGVNNQAAGDKPLVWS